MSVLSHLTNTKDKLVLSSQEKSNIQNSISTLQTRLDTYFGYKVEEHFIFGSKTRGTILPRKADSKSDIDYMVVFDNDEDYKPQTFISKLRKFAQKYYSFSQIKQSHPTVILELNHIKFDLVPAYKNEVLLFGSHYEIPAPSSEYEDWMRTDPNDFNEDLTKKNKNNDYLIKPMIRLIKYWNALNNYVYESFELEKDLVSNSYWFCYNLKDYFYSGMNSLPTWKLPQYKIDKINRALDIIAATKEYEKDEMPVAAEIEIKKLIPELY